MATLLGHLLALEEPGFGYRVVIARLLSRAMTQPALLAARLSRLNN